MDIQVTEKQRLFMDAKEDEVLYGGAAGGGKSYVQLIDNLVYAITYPGIKQLILRRTFPELERSLIRTMLELYPKEVYSYHQSKHTLTFNNGSLTDFGFCDAENDVYKYQSSEYDVIRLDECTHFSGTMYEYLRTRIRGANDFPKQTKCSTNPGNVGHQYFKNRFIDVCVPMKTYEIENPRTHKMSTRLFIPSRVYDNKFLMEKDPEYIERLEGMDNEEERKALLDGSWDIYEGQMFREFSRDVHVIKSLPERDKSWRIYFTMDYGLDMTAGLFIAVDNHDRYYVLGEVYQPDLVISDACALIKKKQRELKIDKVDEYLAPSDLWARRQETGRSVADIFRENGIVLRKTSRDRIDGWAAVKEAVKPFKDEQGVTIAKLRIYEECVNLIRTLPAIQYDERRPGDAATQPHELTHMPDALRYFCVYRYRANRELSKPMDDKADLEYRKFNSNSMYDIYGGKHGDDSDYYNSTTNWSF